MNFKAVLVLPKTAGSVQTHKSITFIWIVWSTLYVYLWLQPWNSLTTDGFVVNYPLTNYLFNNKLHLQIILHRNDKWPSFCKYKRYPVSQENSNYKIVNQKNVCKLFFTYIRLNAPNNSRSYCIWRFYNNDGYQVQQHQRWHL